MAMSDIDRTIFKFKESSKLNAFVRLWRDKYTLDFIEQYWIAFDNFEKVKGAQDRIDRALDRLKLDLAVAALMTLCSGSVVGVLLGEITLTQAAGRVVLDALCRENMQIKLPQGEGATAPFPLPQGEG
jgi:uncharacterized transporter YbjL